MCRPTDFPPYEIDDRPGADFIATEDCVDNHVFGCPGPAGGDHVAKDAGYSAGWAGYLHTHNDSEDGPRSECCAS